MADDDALWQAVDQAWALYRAAHNHVDESDEHRCLLVRHLQQRWRAQEHDPEELTCAGLAFLERTRARTTECKLLSNKVQGMRGAKNPCSKAAIRIDTANRGF